MTTCAYEKAHLKHHSHYSFLYSEYVIYVCYILDQIDNEKKELITLLATYIRVIKLNIYLGRFGDLGSKVF
jgi:hypothetical protein